MSSAGSQRPRLNAAPALPLFVEIIPDARWCFVRQTSRAFPQEEGPYGLVRDVSVLCAVSVQGVVSVQGSQVQGSQVQGGAERDAVHDHVLTGVAGVDAAADPFAKVQELEPDSQR